MIHRRYPLATQTLPIGRHADKLDTPMQRFPYLVQNRLPIEDGSCELISVVPFFYWDWLHRRLLDSRLPQPPYEILTTNEGRKILSFPLFGVQCSVISGVTQDQLLIWSEREWINATDSKHIEGCGLDPVTAFDLFPKECPLGIDISDKAHEIRQYLKQE